MKLYLGSCNLGKDKEELKNWIEKFGKDIILIPNALDIVYNKSVRENMIEEDKIMLENVGFDVKVESLKEYFGDYKKLKECFDKYKAFYVIGGNVFTLRKAMELSGFDRYVKEISSKKDRLYAGYSAGICVLAKNIDIFEFVEEQRNPYNGDIHFKPGLGIIDYLPLPHSDSGNMKQVEDYCKKHNLKFKSIEDGESVLDESKTIELEI